MSYEAKQLLKFLATMALVLGTVFGLLLWWATWETKQPCSYFKDTTAKNIPARCLDYYKVEVK